MTAKDKYGFPLTTASNCVQTEEVPSVTPKEDLMNKALKDYEEAASAVCHWNSDIPKAIRAYYEDDIPQDAKDCNPYDIRSVKQYREKRFKK